MRPVTVADKPLPAHTPRTDPLPLTVPVKPSETILPPEIATTAVVWSEQVVRPKDAEAHVPSKLLLPPPPPPLRDLDDRSLLDGRSRVERELPLS
jgi:hypothetical protein